MEIVAETEDFEISRSGGEGFVDQKSVPITFSSWSSTGSGAYFGANFFNKRGFTGYFIRSKKNHWWHASGLVDFVSKIVDREKDVFFYGASMGGYGALYYSRMFDQKGFSISPQVSVMPENVPDDRRWLGDWEKITPAFDERHFLQKPANEPCICLMDRTHVQDGMHVDILERDCVSASSVHLVEVPNTFHQTVRALNDAGLLEQILIAACLGAHIDIEKLRKLCETAYRKNLKGYAYYIRNNPEKISAGATELLRQSRTKKLDFEESYLLAEIFKKAGLKDEALSRSWASVDLNPADYVIVKHAIVLEELVGPESALLFLSLYKDHKSFGVLSEARLNRVVQLVGYVPSPVPNT